jgi:cell pole-organizing protein PopZ
MSVSRKQIPAEQQDRGMDEILASIRRIIDEDPINPRHRADLSEPRAPERGMARPRSVSAQVRPLSTEDDVLAELLAPAEAPTVKQLASEGELADPGMLRDTAIAVDASVATATAFATTNTNAAAASSVRESSADPQAAASSMSAPPVTKAENATAAPTSDRLMPAADIPSAESVLAALARGLLEPSPSASVIAVAPPAAVHESVPPLPAASEPAASAPARVEAPSATTPAPAVSSEPDASPSEAAAAAVAAVAAVNAAAVQTGSRQRGVHAPDVPIKAVGNVILAAVPIEPQSLLSTVPSPPPETVAQETLEPAAVVSALPPLSDPAPPSVTPYPSTELMPQQPATFEDTISAMLRPILRDWLDDNMPRMVEKALKDEMSGSGGIIAHAVKLARPNAV